MRAFISKISCIKKDQNGFSLVELIAAIGISGIIMVGLVILIFQLFIGHDRSSGEMTIVRQVQQAGYYISRDAHMASIIDDEPSAPEKLKLTWYGYAYHGDWVPPNFADRDGDGFRVIYTLEDGDKLYRNYYHADEVEDPDSPFYGEVNEDDYYLVSRTFIAEYIKEIICNYDGITLILQVTASVNGISGEQVETRIYEIKPRPNVF